MSPLCVCGWDCRAQQRAGAVWKSAVRASPRLEGTQPGRRGLPAGSPWPGVEPCCSLAVHGGQMPLELARALLLCFGLLKGTSKD